MDRFDRRAALFELHSAYLRLAVYAFGQNDFAKCDDYQMRAQAVHAQLAELVKGHSSAVAQPPPAVEAEPTIPVPASVFMAVRELLADDLALTIEVRDGVAARGVRHGLDPEIEKLTGALALLDDAYRAARGYPPPAAAHSCTSALPGAIDGARQAAPLQEPTIPGGCHAD